MAIAENLLFNSDATRLTRLTGPKRDERVDLRRSARGNQAREHADDREYSHYAAEDERVARLDLEQRELHELRDGRCEAKTRDHADRELKQSVA